MINPLIVNALLDVNLPVYFISRGDNPTPCIVFTVVETPAAYSDNQEDMTEYNVLLNVYTSEKSYVTTISKVKECMSSAGFRKKTNPVARWEEDLNSYNQPMEFKFTK